MQTSGTASSGSGDDFTATWRGLPPGPKQRLFKTLYQLRKRRGKPSLRDIAAGTSDGRSVSKTAVNFLFPPEDNSSSMHDRRVPSWPILQSVVVHLEGDLGLFRHLWIQAKEAEEAWNIPTTALYLPWLAAGRHRYKPQRNHESDRPDLTKAGSEALRRAEKELSIAGDLAIAGEVSESKAVIRNAVRTFERVLGLGNPRTVEVWLTLVDVTSWEGDDVAAIEILFEFLARQAAHFGAHHRAPLETRLVMGWLALEKGLFQNAELSLKSLIADAPKRGSMNDDIVLEARELLACAIFSQGRTRCPEAIKDLVEVLRTRRDAEGPDSAAVLRVRSLLARACMLCEQWDGAAHHLRILRDARRDRLGSLHLATTTAQKELCAVLRRCDDGLAEAEQEHLLLLDIYREVADWDTPEILGIWLDLVEILIRRGSLAAAEVNLRGIRNSLNEAMAPPAELLTRIRDVERMVRSARAR